MNDITIPPEAVEAAARAIIIANGGDPDALLRLTIHKTTIKAWQTVAPLARAALAAGLAAWPEVKRVKGYFTHDTDYYEPAIILPLPKEKLE
jgi:hypothetical protein